MPMTNRQALVEAIRRWGDNAFAWADKNSHRVGVIKDGQILYYGSGQTWEEAFAQAGGEGGLYGNPSAPAETSVDGRQ